MFKFDHEKLDVYRTAIELNILSKKITETIPKGNSYFIDQLLRASASITLNIAEGAGEFAKNEKARFYRMAKRSATECAAIIDLCEHLHLVKEEHQNKSRELLIRIVSMLTKMAK